MSTVIVIPAYNPDERLLALTGELTARGCGRIIVVDDGSSSADSAAVFASLAAGTGVVLCRHRQNLGKGAALKTGLREALRLWPECAGVVTADADGQHSAADIVKISAALANRADSLVLGVRDFSAPHVPIHNKLGNKITSAVFRLITGRFCPDTQTGLRGLPRILLPEWINIPGQRYEYEMNLLLHAAKKKTPLAEVQG
ncbi:MAG: glycosyltransferase family 2 protein [Gracilibacteraceae bacterium]|nr:glycosyltransferase family 2 protein [Gracilibacteraceae bacterium]